MTTVEWIRLECNSWDGFKWQLRRPLRMLWFWRWRNHYCWQWYYDGVESACTTCGAVFADSSRKHRATSTFVENDSQIGTE